MNIDIGGLLSNPLTALLLAPLVAKAVDKAKKQFGTLDNASPLAKQAAVFVVAGIAAATGHALQVSPSSIGQLATSSLDPQVLTNAALTALGAIAVKHSQQVQEAKSPVVVAQASVQQQQMPSSNGPTEQK